MKILILSDLHIELEDFRIDTNQVDVVILAGNIHIKEKGFKWALNNIKNIPVLYILGNHEFYTKAYPRLVHKLKDLAQNTNIHILERDTIILNGINFLGCTLWTDFELYGDPRIAGYECQQVMTDYKKIRISPNFSKLRSIDVAAIHRRSINWLCSELEDRQNEINIVISHHAPSEKSLPYKYKQDIISSAYVSNLENVIEKYQPRFWIHGHLHNSSNYKIGQTHIICNPRGYLGERNHEFDAELTIESSAS